MKEKLLTYLFVYCKLKKVNFLKSVGLSVAQKTGFLFSKKAAVPSFLSSLEKTSPNNFASSSKHSLLK
jgi:hypothetical protein